MTKKLAVTEVSPQQIDAVNFRWMGSGSVAPYENSLVVVGVNFGTGCSFSNDAPSIRLVLAPESMITSVGVSTVVTVT